MFCFSVIDSFGFQLLKSMSIICSHLEPPVVELSSRKLLWSYILSTSTNKTDSHIWLKYWWTWRLTPKPPSNNNNNNEQITNWKKKIQNNWKVFPQVMALNLIELDLHVLLLELFSLLDSLKWHFRSEMWTIG
jgi:hypothetical protein